jgi:threonine dehydratase
VNAPGTVSPHGLTVGDVFAARRRIARFVRRTPLVRSAWLSDIARADVHLKLESLQPTNSFKIRGACNALLCAARNASDVISVVTASAGNHGRGIAYAAEALGIHATIFTPANAPESKLAGIRRHGADLRAEAADYDEAERLAKAFARDRGVPFVSPYSDRDVIAGAGTISLELIEDLPRLDVAVCPLGGGGLFSAVGITLRALSPSTRIFGVEAEASPAFHVSLAAGRITTIDPKPTLADGLTGNMDPDTITFEIVRNTIDGAELVSEADITAAIRGLAAHEHVIAEGAGAVGVAAILSKRLNVEGLQVAVIVSGGNIDALKLKTLLG